MRTKRTLVLLPIGLLVGLVVLISSSRADEPNAESLYLSGHFKEAIPLLRASIAAKPEDPVPSAQLLTSLVNERLLSDAEELADRLTEKFPDSSDVLAARGDLAFYRGDMAETQKLYVQALKVREANAHAHYGMYRLFRSASMYATARLHLLRAYEINPREREISVSWFAMLTPERRKELHEQFKNELEPLDGDELMAQEFGMAVDKQLNGRRTFEPVQPVGETTLHLLMLGDPRRTRAVGLEVSFNGGRPLKLMFDSGAGGILINQRAAEKAGLTLVGQTEGSGIGDSGNKVEYGALAETCKVGTLEYKTCFVRALEGKSITDEDGLIGADFFAQYLMTLDFQRFSLHLKPLPERPPRPQGYDRTIADDEKDFTPVFRFGHHLMITTMLNAKATGLFVLDTGSSTTLVDSTFAVESTKISRNDFVRVRGISGESKNVFEADKAIIQFANFRQRNLGMLVVDINNSGRRQPVRISGLLGLPVLSMFHLSLDYRNGLVKFDPVVPH
jgi:tetratricopeptide (TPR) repeat protein